MSIYLCVCETDWQLVRNQKWQRNGAEKWKTKGGSNEGCQHDGVKRKRMMQIGLTINKVRCLINIFIIKIMFHTGEK